MNEFKKLLKTTRKKKGWDQLEMANQLHVTQQTVSRWELGKVKPEQSEMDRVIKILEQINSQPSPTEPPSILWSPSKFLPLYDLSDDRFEQFCLDLVKLLTPPGSKVHIFGKQGDEQFGIDIYAILPNNQIKTYQCKKIEKRGQFGPQKVHDVVQNTDFTKVIEETGDRDLQITEHYLLVTKSSATAGERKAILQHGKKWDLWDLIDIASEIRKQSKAEQLRLIDAHCPNQRYNFLGIQEKGVWETVEGYFTPYEGRRLSINHSWDFVGRTNSIKEVAEFIQQVSKQFLVINGIGGIGKTKFVKEVTAKIQNRRIFIAPSIQPLRQEDLYDLPEDCVLVIEDTHLRSDLPQLFAGLSLYRPKCKILLTTRPQGLPRLKAGFLNAGLEFSDSAQVINLSSLSQSEAIALALQVISEYKGDERYAEAIAHLGKDCPLILVLAAKLISQKKLLADVLNDKEDFQRIILTKFEEVVTGSIDTQEDSQLTKKLLDLIALIQPITLQDESFYELAQKVVKAERDDIDKKLNLLENSGILTRRGTKLKLVPDLLADQIREHACFSDTTKRSTGYADRVFETASGKLAANLLKNVGQLDRRIYDSGVQPELVSGIWENVKKQFSSSGIWQRGEILEIVKEVAYFQPQYALDIAEFALNNRTQETGLSSEFGTKLPYKHVLEKIPPVLGEISYNLDYLLDACNLLWRIAEEDSRATNQFPSHPLRVLEDIAEYSPRKPLIYSEKVLDTALAKIKSSKGNSRLIPYKILEKLLETESHTTETTERYTITMSPFFVNLDLVDKIRTKVFDFAFRRLIESDDLGEKLQALQVINRGLDGPRPILGAVINDEIRDKWEANIVPIYQKLIEIVKEQPLDPIVLVKIREAVFWEAHHSKGKTKELAQTLINEIPTSFEEKFTRALIDDYGRFFDRLDQDIHDVQKRWDEWLTEIALEVHKHFPNKQDLLRSLETKIQQLTEVPGLAPVSHSHFIRKLIEQCKSFSVNLCTYIINKPDSALISGLSTAIPLAYRESKEIGKELFERILQSKNKDLMMYLGHSISWGFTGEEIVDDIVFPVLTELISSNDPGIKLSAVNSIRRVSEVNRKKGLELALSIDLQASVKLAEEVFTEFRHGVLSIEDLDFNQVKRVLKMLLDCESVEGYYAGWFLCQLSGKYPMEVVRFFIERIEHREVQSNTDFRPLPFLDSKQEDYLFPQSEEYEKAMKEVIGWVLIGKEKWERRYFGAELFSLVVGKGEDYSIALKVLKQLLDNADQETLEGVALLISELPPEFIWNNTAFIEELLSRASIYGRKSLGRVSSGLIKPLITGMRSGTPGEPFPQDIEMRDRARNLRQQLPKGSYAERFFGDVQSHAEHNIERSVMDDLDERWD